MDNKFLIIAYTKEIGRSTRIVESGIKNDIHGLGFSFSTSPVFPLISFADILLRLSKMLYFSTPSRLITPSPLKRFNAFGVLTLLWLSFSPISSCSNSAHSRRSVVTNVTVIWQQSVCGVEAKLLQLGGSSMHHCVLHIALQKGFNIINIFK